MGEDGCTYYSYFSSFFFMHFCAKIFMHLILYLLAPRGDDRWRASYKREAKQQSNVSMARCTGS